MMNYTEFKIWSREAADEDVRLPKINDCVLEMIEQREVGFSEIPAEILLSVSDIKYLFSFRISGYENETAVGYARKFARRLAEQLAGVLEEDGTEPEYHVEKMIPPAVNEYTEMLTLSVWFDKNKNFTELFDKILTVFEREFPFALPVRFGESMPPECEYSGREGFLAFLAETPAPVWYARRPVTHVIINDAGRAQAKREGLRVNRISLRMPDAVYEIPEWKFALRRLLKSLSAVCGGFFGQICRGESGIVSWWWQGVPLELGVACTIGEPYWSLIPDCVCAGEQIDEHMAYFEEPNGPLIPEDLLSCPKKRFGQSRLYPDNFTVAKKLPIK